MKEVYLDNAATSRFKPEGVLRAINDFYRQIGCSPGRGGYECSFEAGRVVLESRIILAKLFNVPTPEQIIFTHNVTHALNYALKGLLKSGDHVITTSMEHNAVVRPLNALEEAGIIELDYILADQQGLISPLQVEEAIKENTRVLVTTHASNVTGSLLPLAELAKLAQKHDLFYILDTAQTAGIYELDFIELGLDVLAFTGHKSLLGPTGTGGFAVSKKAAHVMETLIEGGTGSISDREYQPDFLPDKFESGTFNTMGLAGLKAGVEFIKNKGLEEIKKHELSLAQNLITGLKELAGVKIYGPANIEQQTPTISISVDEVDLGQLSFMLDDDYGIMTRSGLHCAPLAHKTIGSFPEGTLRFSIGYFNTQAEIDYTLESLAQILREY